MQQTNWKQGAAINPARGFRVHLIVFLLAVPALWLVWYLTGLHYPWPIWPTLAWGVGLIFHYLGVFVFKKANSN